MKDRKSIERAKWVAIIFVIMSYFGISQWTRVNFLPNLTSLIVLNLICYAILLYVIYKNRPTYKQVRKNSPLLFLYLIWLIVCSFRSIPELTSRTAITTFLNNFAGSFFICLIPLIAKPLFLKQIIKYWRWLTLPLFVIVCFNTTTPNSWGFYLCFLQIYFLFWQQLNWPTRIIVLGLSLIIVITGYVGDARAHMVKYGYALLLGLLSDFTPLAKFFLHKFWLRILHIVVFLTPIVLAYLGVTGVLNVFAFDEKEQEDNTMIADTRTFIYTEAIISAYDNNYIWTGRTPARGYNSIQAEVALDESNLEWQFSDHAERQGETGSINVFTWYGLIGLILYGLLYFILTEKALFRSNNMYMRLIGLYVLFRWVMFWVEDYMKFDSMNITLWILLSFCYLNYYRKLNDRQFKFVIKKMNFNIIN